MKKTEFRDIVLKKLEETHETFFEQIHTIAGTKSGDISPEQVIELHGLTNKLVDLMVEQVMQNNPANITYPVVIEKHGLAVRIEEGFLTATQCTFRGEFSFSEHDSDWGIVFKSSEDVDIAFLDDIYEETGWIYLKDYKLGTL